MYGKSVTLLEKSILIPNEETSVDESECISLLDIVKLSITARCHFGSDTTKPITIKILSSQDAINWDTEPLLSFNLPCRPGEDVQKTRLMFPDVMYIKAKAQNPNTTGSVTNLVVSAFVAEP